MANYVIELDEAQLTRVKEILPAAEIKEVKQEEIPAKTVYVTE